MAKKQITMFFSDSLNRNLIVRGFELSDTSPLNNLDQLLSVNYYKANALYESQRPHEQALLAYFRTNNTVTRSQCMELARESGYNVLFSDDNGERVLTDTTTVTSFFPEIIYTPALGVRITVDPPNLPFGVFRSVHAEDNFVKIGDTDLGTGEYLDEDVYIGLTCHYKVRIDEGFKTPFTEVQSFEIVPEA